MYTVEPGRGSAVGWRVVARALDYPSDPLFVPVVRPEPDICSRWEVIRCDTCFRTVAPMLGASSARRATLHLDRWRATLLLAVRRPHELRPADRQDTFSWEEGCGHSVSLGRNLLTLDHLAVTPRQMTGKAGKQGSQRQGRSKVETGSKATRTQQGRRRGRQAGRTTRREQRQLTRWRADIIDWSPPRTFTLP